MFEWRRPQHPYTNMHAHHVPKFRQVFVKMHAVLIEDVQVPVNSDDFHLEGKFAGGSVHLHQQVGDLLPEAISDPPPDPDPDFDPSHRELPGHAPILH